MNDSNWDPLAEQPLLQSVRVFGVELRVGDRVRLWPQKTADIMDMALQGQVAVIEAIEQDFEGQAHLAVVLEDDPGRDFGMMRQPGHRFFFSPEEVEPLVDLDLQGERMKDQVLVAGVGNIFLGDDAFGVEVARAMATRDLPEGVVVRDFGIRSFDLAYGLLDDWSAVILVDAVSRNAAPARCLSSNPILTSLPRRLKPRLSTVTAWIR